jgi:large subunit ribosomal protein L9e
MKDIYKDEELAVPEGVKVTIRARTITVEGPKGTLCKVRQLSSSLTMVALLPTTGLPYFLFAHC